MSSLARLVPLIFAAGILLAGNGLQGTLIALRANLEGFPISLIGLMGTGYFAGFAAGSLLAPRLVMNVGHIRVFAAMAAMAATAALALVLVLDPWVWVGLRTATGFCFAGLFLVIESWLNAEADNEDRGRILSIYRVVDLSFVAGSQFLLPLYPVGSFELFSLIAVMFCFALVPVALARGASPKRPSPYKFKIGNVWRVSQLACVGCVTIGMTNSSFRMIGPVYAGEIGLSIGQLAFFISASIVGGAVTQIPFGWLSDRFDRRWVLILATSGAVIAGLLLTLASGDHVDLVYLGAFLFGAFAMPLYSLSIAHANDFAEPHQYVELSAGLIFFYGLGATAGPFAASLVIEYLGAAAFFSYTSVIHGSLVLFVLYRMTKRATVPRWARKPYTALLRTSPAFSRSAPTTTRTFARLCRNCD